MARDGDILALHYGTLETSRLDVFLDYSSYGEENAPITMDYFFWVIRRASETIVVDTGFDPDVGARRGRTCLVAPLRALEFIGVQPDDVSLVLLTHMHYDHVGNLAAFPRADVLIQRRELEHWRGLQALDASETALVEPAELELVDDLVARGRLSTIEGDDEVRQGVRLELVGGHTPGQQIVVVESDGGTTVLASDAIHFYEEMERRRPFVTFSDLPELLAAYDLLREWDRRPDTQVVAGHDPDVLRRFPSRPCERGHVVQLSTTS